MLKMKSGQISQVFIYIFAMVVAAMIFYLGFTLIPKITNLSCNVETQNTKISFETEIGKVYNLGYESVKTLSAPSSCGIYYVCLIGKEPNFNIIPEDKRAIIKLRSEKNYNFFIITNRKASPIEYSFIENMDVKNGTICIEPTGNNFIFKAKNLGDHVEIF